MTDTQLITKNSLLRAQCNALKDENAGLLSSAMASTKLRVEIERLRETNAELLEVLQDAIRGLEWWIAEYPESASEIDNEAIAAFRIIIAKAIKGAS